MDTGAVDVVYTSFEVYYTCEVYQQQGFDEAGIDQDGVFKEFPELAIKQVFDPALNLFLSTAAGVLYPTSTSSVHEDHLALFRFVGGILAKALYEGIVVDVQLAPVLLAAMVGGRRLCAFDKLSQLDPELYRNLTFVKKYEGDVNDLWLTFSIDGFYGQDKYGGFGARWSNYTRLTTFIAWRSIVSSRSRHEAAMSCFCCRCSIRAKSSLAVFIFAARTKFIISEYTSDIDLADLKKHVQYYGGFHGSHRLIKWFWEIVEKDFTADERRLFLKFVISCLRPPLLGFSHLEPVLNSLCRSFLSSETDQVLMIRIRVTP